MLTPSPTLTATPTRNGNHVGHSLVFPPLFCHRPPPQPSPAAASYAARSNPDSEGEDGSLTALLTHGATLKMRKGTRKRKRKTLKPVGIQIFLVLFLVLFLEILLFRL